MFKNVSKTDLYISIFIVVFGVFIYFFNVFNQIGDTRFNSDNLSYATAQVVNINKEKIEEDKYASDRYYGVQELVIEFISGDLKGETKTIDNYLSTTHNIRLEMGQKFIACIDQPENENTLISVYNYYRTPVIYIMVFAFIGVLVLVGGSKGVRSALGLIFTFAVIITLMLPMMYKGYSPVLSCIFTVIVTTTVTLFMLNGNSKKTISAILSTASGVIIAGILFTIFSKFLYLSGFNTGEAESLLLISQQTGLKIKYILFAGILISSLGAVMDVALSIASSINEVIVHKPDLTVKELFNSGINVGRDMIGTMSNTLILAFTGSSLSMLLALLSYGVKYDQLLNSDYIAMEIAQGLCGTMAVILTVPIASIVSAYLYKSQSKLRLY